MKKILVTGGSGLVGSALKKQIDGLYPNSRELNLVNRDNVFDYFEKNSFDCVIHVAGRVGGVAANTNYVSDFYSENILMNTNILDASVKFRIPKVICCLSTCIYPDEKFVKYPLTEDQLHSGEPHKSNFGYAYAKRMVDIQIKAIKQQHGLDYISIVPNNLYGENDNFDLSNGHVLPALIRKVWEAKRNKKENFEVWGDGEVYREFTYSADIAKSIKFLLEKDHIDGPINIGNTTEYCLRDVIKLICEELQYEGNITFDITKPKGQVRKPTSNYKFIDLGWKKEWYTSIEEGIKNTCDWFKQNYPNVRGV